MNLAEFDEFCGSLPATTMVIQWGGAHVWKVGGKVFALAAKWGDANLECRIGFKTSDMAFMMLTDQPDIVPLPYLGRYKWVQLTTNDALSDEEERAYIETAHGIISAKLSRSQRSELGLN